MPRHADQGQGGAGGRQGQADHQPEDEGSTHWVFGMATEAACAAGRGGMSRPRLLC